jgi:hypothetical protein
MLIILLTIVATKSYSLFFYLGANGAIWRDVT